LSDLSTLLEELLRLRELARRAFRVRLPEPHPEPEPAAVIRELSAARAASMLLEELERLNDDV
jgi:hypothetical protein